MTDRTERVGEEQVKDKSPAASRTAGLFLMWTILIAIKVWIIYEQQFLHALREFATSDQLTGVIA